jgi:hypothetical protein
MALVPTHVTDFKANLTSYASWNLMCQLERKGISVTIDWTPGHAAIAGNEIADRLVKEASDTAKGMDKLESIVTLGTIKSSARASVQAKWQRQWDASDTGRRMYGFKQSVKTQSLVDHPHKPIYNKIARLRAGYVGLNKYMHQIGCRDSPMYESWNAEETVQHYLLDCIKFEEEREWMITNIYKECGVGAVTEELLLSVDSEDSLKEHRTEINRLLGEFVKRTAHI